MKSHEIFKRNVKARLELLELPSYKVSILTGHAGAWLSGILNPRRHSSRVSSLVIDEVGEALGVPPYELINPAFDAADYPLPQWSMEI